jgi:hypothetical protein
MSEKMISKKTCLESRSGTGLENQIVHWEVVRDPVQFRQN